MKSRMLSIVAIIALSSGFATAADKPVKIYIFAGQSNMQGTAKVETFNYIGDDPATAPMLKLMRDPDGRPRVCEKVWVSYLNGSPDKKTLGEGVGKLTAGYGARKTPTEDGGMIGPEFTFGIYASKAYDGPILIIKNAWGGKSLHTDFRPPSAGPYQFSESQLDGLKKQGKDITQVKADKVAKTGRYYKLMIEHVKKVLADPKRVCPAYDKKAGYEIAGFVWFQGWNDMVDSGTYPNRRKPGGYDSYSQWMADFIRDVRKDLNVPKMPFIVGVMGVSGLHDANEHNLQFREAMVAPSKFPEFKGDVAAVQTAPFWDDVLGKISAKRQQLRGQRNKLNNKLKAGELTRDQFNREMAKFEAELISPEEATLWSRGASNQGYHYLGSAKTFALVGKAFAETMLQLMETAADH